MFQELSKALNYDTKDKDNQKGNTSTETKAVNSVRSNDISNYPTLRAGEQYPQEVYSARQSDSPLPPPPPTTLPPSSNNTKIQQQFLETPPRIDRNNKPSRFRSAHERLFGTKNGPPALNGSAVENGNYQVDDSDYINTSAPVQYKEFHQAKITPNPANVNGQRYVTGAFGDTSSYSSDSYNKYGSPNSTLEAKQGHVSRNPSSNDPYKFTRSTAQPLSHLTGSSKNSSLERNKPLPPPPPHKEPNTGLTSTFAKNPPSPPPKPTYKFTTQSLQYQM